MATKPTGRKPGRPKKPAPPPRKPRRRGPKPRSGQEDRYALAIALAIYNVNEGMSVASSIRAAALLLAPFRINAAGEIITPVRVSSTRHQVPAPERFEQWLRAYAKPGDDAADSWSRSTVKRIKELYERLEWPLRLWVIGSACCIATVLCSKGDRRIIKRAYLSLRGLGWSSERIDALARNAPH